MKREELMILYKKLLLEIIEKVDVRKGGRKNKFSNEFYLDYIFRIFFYGEYWNTFYCPHCDRSTIRKKFYKWRDLGVFDIAFEHMREKYYKHRTFKYLFIDSAILQNMNCSDFIDFHYKMKTKKTLKLSIICDNNYTVSSYSISNPKIHDSKFTVPLMKQSKAPLKKRACLVGDKGYISKDAYKKLQKKGVKLVTPLKKNQKKSKEKNEKNKKLLKARGKVEHTFTILKKSYKRLQLIFDRIIVNFNTFLLMAFTCQFIRNFDNSEPFFIN